MRFSARYNDQGKRSLTVKIGLPPSQTYRRSSIVPYIVDSKSNLRYFIFALPERCLFNNLSDFGGKSKQNEYWQDSAWREFEEESYGCFGLDRCDLTTTGFSDHCTISLVQIHDLDLEDLEYIRDSYRKFYQFRLEAKYPEDQHENCDIVWIREDLIEFDRLSPILVPFFKCFLEPSIN